MGLHCEGRLAVQVTKSLKTLIMNASLGAGSELEIEIAKGVDWTAILAIILGVKQVRWDQTATALLCVEDRLPAWEHDRG